MQFQVGSYFSKLGNFFVLTVTDKDVVFVALIPITIGINCHYHRLYWLYGLKY